MTLAIRDEAPLTAWAETFRATAEVCAQLARTPFVPNSLRVFDGAQLDDGATAAQITAAILTGDELGIPPMSALRSIAVINATPALSSLAMRALVVHAGHLMWTHESTKTRAIVRGKRADSPHVEESVWTMDRAKEQRLANRPQWQAMPQAMLFARANAECARRVAPDVLLGLPYAAEELADGPELDAPAEPEQAPPSRKRTARRAPRKIVDAELPPETPASGPQAAPPALARVASDTGPDAGPSSPVGVSADDEGDAPSDSRVGAGPSSSGRSLTPLDRALHATFNDLGITDRDDRLAMTSQIIGRDVASSAEMSDDEKHAVLNELKLLAARETEWVPPDDEPPFDE